MSWGRSASLSVIDNKPTMRKCVQCQAAQRGNNLHTVCFEAALRIFIDQGDGELVSGEVNRPEVFHMLQPGCGFGPDTRDVITGLVDLLHMISASDHKIKIVALPAVFSVNHTVKAIPSVSMGAMALARI